MLTVLIGVIILVVVRVLQKNKEVCGGAMAVVHDCE